jgi:hypothetical protein
VGRVGDTNISGGFCDLRSRPHVLLLQQVASSHNLQKCSQKYDQYIRVTADSKAFITSNVTTFEPSFDIQWVWLIYPSALIITGVVFLGICIIETEQSKAPVWKTSQLALLLHGMDSESIDGLGVVAQSEIAMKRQFKGLEMMLQEKGEGLSL